MSHFDLARVDTICAPATALAPAAIAVVRVSGRDASRVRDAVFRPRRPAAPRPFVATLGDVVDRNGELLDEAICTVFPEGRSYTGEASFELSLHGGLSRVRSALRALVDAGCRPAEPGELTMRAVLCGRLDLSRAESVADLIAAKSDAAARAALNGLRGGLSTALAGVRGAIVDSLAELEARLDFPDEPIGSAAIDAIDGQLDKAGDALSRLLRGAAFGERLVQGARVVLYGVPNAGKSTLLNALVGEERALVHESPGTTRDVLEAEVVFDGVPAVVVDVAGVRNADNVDPVERMGIERARAQLDRADVVVLVVDATRPDARPDDAPARAVVVHNKADLVGANGAQRGSTEALELSATTGDGLSALRDALAERLREDAPDSDEVLLTRARQREEVAAARDALSEAQQALRAGQPHEIVAAELRRAGNALDRLLGTHLDEDVLDVVFSRFCIGK